MYGLCALPQPKAGRPLDEKERGDRNKAMEGEVVDDKGVKDE